MTQLKKMQSKLTIVATAHNEDIHNRIFVESMLNQTTKGYKSIVWHNGSNVFMETWIQDMNDGRYEEGVSGYIQYKNSQKDTGNWGTANRQQAITECDTEYIIQTSIQDYWLPQAMQYILNAIERYNPDLIIWDSINHLVGPCKVLESKLEWARIDWGNFAIKTEIAKKVGINHGDQYCADWLFIQDVINSGLVDEKKILKIPYILTIHN